MRSLKCLISYREFLLAYIAQCPYKKFRALARIELAKVESQIKQIQAVVEVM